LPTDIAGIPEQVEDGESGYLIPTGTPSTLADCLDELLSNSDLRKQMGQKGYERTERFSIKTMLDDFDNLYQELIC
jgi:glycosyltransferase involved in cell wall biosynthesis